MKKWLEELDNKLSKYLEKEERQEAIGFYEEMIYERIDGGEKEKDILKEYNVNEIANEIASNAIVKRDFSNKKVAGKSVWHILLILFSSPILIPLGLVYLSVVIVFGALLLTSVVLIASLLIALIAYIPSVFVLAPDLSTQLGMLGLGIIGITFGCFVSVMLYKVSWLLTKTLLVLFAKALRKKKPNHEEHGQGLQKH